LNTQSQIIDVPQGKTGSWVTLVGRLISKIGEEQYRLRDMSGMMDVRIPQKAWQGYHFDAVDVVRITGRVTPVQVTRQPLMLHALITLKYCLTLSH